MDGIGYGNWNSQSRRHTGADLEDSYESSSPPTYTSDPYGFDSDTGHGGRSSHNYSMASKKDNYDFNLNTDDTFGDFSDSSPAPISKPKLSRRVSTEERMAEILKENKKTVDSGDDNNVGENEGDIYGSWKSSWNQLMEGVDAITSPINNSLNKSVESTPPVASKRSKSVAAFSPKANLLNTSDSFEISEADFEVGTHAARRSQEMLEDRRRQSMASFVGTSTSVGDNSSMPLKKKVSNSPDISTKKTEKKQQQAHFSTAGISSIDPDEDFGDDYRESMATDKGIRKYGSVGGKSDGDLLKVLAETKETFRYPVSVNSSSSTDIYSPGKTTGPSPPSKRRQMQMDKRKSITPPPGKNGAGKMATHDESEEKDDEDDGYDDDDPHHTGDYSMDDFDDDSPGKMLKSNNRPASDDGKSDDEFPENAPILGRFQSAPLPLRKISKEEEEAQRSMDEIKNRWANMSSVSKLFPAVEEGTADNEENVDNDDANSSTNKSEQSDQIQKPENSSSPPDRNQVEKEQQSPTPQADQNNDTSFQSLVNGPPPPPDSDFEEDTATASATISTSSNAFSKVQVAGNAGTGTGSLSTANVDSDNKEIVSTAMDEPDDMKFDPRQTFQKAVGRVIENNCDNLQDQGALENNQVDRETFSENERGMDKMDTDFENQLRGMTGNGGDGATSGVNGPGQHFTQHVFNNQPTHNIPLSGHPYQQQPNFYQYSGYHPPPPHHFGYNSIERYPWQDPHFHTPIEPNRHMLPHSTNNAPFQTLAGTVEQPFVQSGKHIAHNQRPKGTEIDPAEFVQENLNRTHGSSSTAPGNWPATIPLTSPSVTELHAHIASIQSKTDATKSVSNKTVAQNVALIKKKTKGKSRPSNYVRTRIGREATNGRNVLESTDDMHNPPILDNAKHSTQLVDGPKWSAINRIEAGNNRLLQQFEELDREIREMKLKKSAKTTQPKSYRQTNNVTSKPFRPSNGGVERISTREVVHKRDANFFDSLDEHPPPPPPEGEIPDDQDNKALEAIKSIFRESVDRENLLLQREKALDVRESLFTSTYYANNENTIAQSNVNDEKLLEENQNLKAELYELRAAKKRGFKPATHCGASENPVQSGSSIDGDDKDEEDKYSSESDQDCSDDREAKKRTGKKSQKGKGVETITVNREEYESLLKNYSELENVVSLYEKSNERLVGEVSEKDKEMKALKADFFNQQESLVRETNLLKNKLNSAIATNATNVNDTSVGHLLSRPDQVFHMKSSFGGVEFKEALHKEALLQDLHEQVVRLGKNNLEKEKEIEKLTSRINELQRESVIMSKTMEQYSTMAGKGKALVDAFYPPSGADKEGGPPRRSDLNMQRSRPNFLHWGVENRAEDTSPKIDDPHLVDKSLLENKASDSELVTQLKQELHRVQVESLSTIASLRSRLAWFAENQKIIDSVEKEKKTLERTLEEERDKSTNLNDSSVSGVGKSKNSSQRSLADIRRIKELETALVACRESIQKRFPDSVANLLYANVVGSIPTPGAAGDDKKDNESKLADVIKEKEHYRQQVEKVTAEGEQRLRSLRQEFERMRIGYENTIQKLNHEMGLPPVPFVSKATGSVPSTNTVEIGGKSSPVRSFGEAKHRIQELEVELARVRNFYTKKLETLQRKHQGQLSALRRGETNVVTSDRGGRNVDAVELQAEKKELMNRITLLENEVLTTAEELGRVRALNEAGAGLNKDLQTTVHDNKENKVLDEVISDLRGELKQVKEENSKYRLDIKRMERELQCQEGELLELKNCSKNSRNIKETNIAAEEKRFDKQASGESEMSASELEKLVANQSNKIMAMSEDWKHEKDELKETIKNVRREKEEIEGQLKELQKTLFGKDGEIQHWQGHALKLEMINQQAKTPQMQQFLAMEQQIASLESRLARREQELARMVDESKASGHLERLRLQSIHEQEIREKDEQLLRFEGELEELVTALHHLQEKQ